MAHFKDLFAELRKDTGLSQEKFAEVFHQAGSTISSYETGRNTPSFDMLIQYADYFGVTTDYLIGRTPHNMSPAILTEKFVDNTSICEVLGLLKDLSTSRRRAILLVLRDLSFSSTIQEKANHNSKGG